MPQITSVQLKVGLEIHVELATRSKMFAAAPSAAHPDHYDAQPNSLIDPVVLALPGALPVVNRAAVEMAMMVGLALGCSIAPVTRWDRKSYFYPDLPKNYQISQYRLPLCFDGAVDIPGIGEGGRPDPSLPTRRIGIIRAHLEEDAGKLLHEAPGGRAIDHSVVDYNRAGTPLLEIVTQPDFTTAEEVVAFAQQLRSTCRFLGVTEGVMQRGHMRFEPNINVHITDASGQVHKTAITEIKNLNSFSVLQRATDYEIQRQIHHWIETGDLGRKCTMGWDESTGTTFVQREKEEAHDYRYFPDPDLMPVEVSDAWLDEIRRQVGELPAARRARYVQQLGLSPADAATLAGDRRTGDYYEQALAAGADPKRAANLLINVLMQLAKQGTGNVADLAITPRRLADVAILIDQNKLAASSALPLFENLQQSPPGDDVTTEQRAGELGLIQSSDTSAIDAAIDAVIAQNPKPLQDFKAGKQQALGALTGMIMRSAKGLNPKLVQERLRERLG